MANGDPLPSSDYVSRACGRRGVEAGVVQAAAFGLRQHKTAETEFGKISVDWVECTYDVAEWRNIEGSIRRLKARLIFSQPVAILPVSGVRSIRRNGHPLDARKDGHRVDVMGCHCVIVGFTGGPLDLELQDALAELANKSSVLELDVDR